MKKILLLTLLALLFMACGVQPSYYLILNIECDVDGAEVYINDKFVAKTPVPAKTKISMYTDKEEDISLSIKKDFYKTIDFEYKPNIEKKYATIEGSYNLAPGLDEYDGVFALTDYKNSFADLIKLNIEQLKVRYTEIKARFGAPIEDQKMREYFNNQRWYKENSNYTDEVLQEDDKLCMILIEALLQNEEEDLRISRKILPGNTFTGFGIDLLIKPYGICIDQKSIDTPIWVYGAIGGHSLTYQEAIDDQKKWWDREYFVYKTFLIYHDESWRDNAVVHINEEGKIDYYEQPISFDRKAFQIQLQNRGLISDIKSSGYRKELYDQNAYHDVKAFDNHPETAWIENESNAGIKRSLNIFFYPQIRIDEIRIMGGYFDPLYYKENNRLKKINLYLSGTDANDHWSEFETIMEFEDSMTEQSIKFQDKTTEQVKIIILEVYFTDTNKFNDTAISEVSFYYKGKKIDIQLGEYAEFSQVKPKL